jgi:uncharacterized protein YxeA
MKKINIILILLFFFFIISAVSAENDLNSTDSDSLLLKNSTSDVSLEVSKIETKDLVKYYKNDSQFDFKVLDDDNKPVYNKTVLLNVAGKNYTKVFCAYGGILHPAIRHAAELLCMIYWLPFRRNSRQNTFPGTREKESILPLQKWKRNFGRGTKWIFPIWRSNVI